MELDSFAEKWDSKYPTISKSWHENWATLSTYFKYPNEVKKSYIQQILLRNLTVN